MGDFGEAKDELPNLITKITEYLEDLKDIKHSNCIATDGQPVVSFLTPIMMRAHSLK